MKKGLILLVMMFLTGYAESGVFMSAIANGMVRSNDCNDSRCDNEQPGTPTLSISFGCLSGSYTLGDSMADFPNFATLLATLDSFGICGTTTIRIKPGIYLGQLTVTPVLGASDSSRLIFESYSGMNTDVTLQYASTSTTDNWTIRLDGADYISIRNLTIKNFGTTYGVVFEVINGANYSVVEGCRMIRNAGNSAVIYDNTTLNHYNTYKDNYLEGGNVGISVYGIPGSAWEKGTVIQNNEIVGWSSIGIIAVRQDSLQILGNYIHGGSNSSSTGIILNGTINGYWIIGNRVELSVPTALNESSGIKDIKGNHPSFQPNPTGYGWVANNIISIFGYTGWCCGIYTDDVNGTTYCYNSVNITGTSSHPHSCALCQESAPYENPLGSTFLNNIWSNQSGGYVAFFNIPGSVNRSDYNNFYANASTLLTFWGSPHSTLAAHQWASGKDAHSLNVTPGFLSSTDLHILNASLNGAASPITDVLLDFDGQVRDTLVPDIGADEFICASVFASLSPSGPLVICQGDSVHLTAAQGNCYSYKWLMNGVIIPNQTGQTLIPTISGSYAVAITDFNNLSALSSIVQVSVIPKPNPNIIASGPLTFCDGGAILLTADTTAGLHYQWKLNGVNLPMDTLNNITINQSGTYSVLMTNSFGCSQESNPITVTVNSLPTATITPNSPTTFCRGGSVQLNANTGSGLTYMWEKDSSIIPGATSAFYLATMNGVYKVRVTNSNSCSTLSPPIAVTVNPQLSATITSNGSTNICQGDTVSLSTSLFAGVTYQWLHNGVLQSNTLPTLQTGLAGNYNVVLIDTNNCSDTSSVIHVTVNPLPPATVWSTGDHFCPGDTLLLYTNSGLGLFYQWVKDGVPILGASSSTYPALLDGVYQVEVTDSMGCKKVSDSLLLFNYSPFEGELICAVTLDSASAKNLVLWEKTPGVRISDYNIYREGSAAGQYNLIGTVPFDSMSVFLDQTANPLQQSYRYKLAIMDSCGNESSLSLAQNTIHLTLNLGASGEINLLWTAYENGNYQSHKVLRSNAGSPYIQIGQVSSNQFSFTDLNPPLGLNRYFIEIEMGSGCSPSMKSGEKGFNIQSNKVNMTMIGVEDFISIESVSVFPNPNDGSFLIRFPDVLAQKVFSIRIIDSQGRIVDEIIHENGQSEMELSYPGLANGIYCVTVDGILGVKRIIIMK